MSHSTHHRSPAMAAAALGALGIVFGDIGTSPIYAFRECFYSPHGVVAPISPSNLLGAASLIIWSLLFIVSVKYLFLILKLDNRGEGGILALSALIRHHGAQQGKKESKMLLWLGLGGAALIYADGMLTPAISVLSAVEGISVSAPSLSKWTVWIAVAILIGLFSIQKYGTGKVGRLFGPIVLLWFLTLGSLGIYGILKSSNPSMLLLSLSPHSGIQFLIHEWPHALPLLSAVFLAVTGGEALYADLGHFGIRPIRFGWFTVVLPCLVLNYMGQAALVIDHPETIKKVFYLLAPEYLRLPLTILATLAAIVASQALITGAFSLTTQAIQTGCLPRIRILYTSEHEIGQVYVPTVNLLLAIACVMLVVGFQSSSMLASAYGIAIAMTMTITTILFYFAACYIWHWSKLKALFVTSLFLVVDFAFLAANITKVFHWGFLALIIGFVIMSLMLIWIWGRSRIWKRILKESLPIEMLLDNLSKDKIHRVSGTAIYMSGRGQNVPTALLHNLKHNQVLHDRIILLHVTSLDQPRAQRDEMMQYEDLGQGIHSVILNFGFAETPHIPKTLDELLPEHVKFAPNKVTYFLGRESYGISKRSSMFDHIRLSIFAAMARNASPATAYFQLPPSRVVELGAQMTI